MLGILGWGKLVCSQPTAAEKEEKKRTESADAAGPGQELIIISHPPRMYLPSKLGNIQFWETGTCTKIHKKLKSTS